MTDAVERTNFESNVASGYTPTTEEVRNQYSGFSTSNSNHTGQVYINLAKFDRWLAEVKADAFDIGAASQRNAYARNIYREGNK